MLSRRDDTFQTLVVHFSHRFFDTDTPSEESVPRNRLIQFLALIAVVSPLLMILVVYGMQGLQLQIGGFDLAWLQGRDSLRAGVLLDGVMGLVMTFSWDSLFLDKRDYLILGVSRSQRSVFLQRKLSPWRSSSSCSPWRRMWF
jgi:hypothetical protein